MLDAIKCLFLSSSITLFANVPQMFEYPVEKLTFGALLFFIIWTYMKTILPKNQEEYARVCEENRKLLSEVERLGRLLEKSLNEYSIIRRGDFVADGKERSMEKLSRNENQKQHEPGSAT